MSESDKIESSESSGLALDKVEGILKPVAESDGIDMLEFLKEHGPRFNIDGK